MNIDILNLFPIAASLSILLLGILSSLFYYFLSRHSSGNVKKSAYFLMLSALMGCIGLGASSIRIYFPDLEWFAILSNNFIYSLSALFLWHALSLRIGNRRKMIHNPWVYLNLILIIFLNGFLFYLWIPSLGIRIIVLYANLAIVSLCIAHSIIKNAKFRQSALSVSDKLLIVTAVFSSTVNFFIPFIIVLVDRLDMLWVVTLPLQTSTEFLWAMIVLTTFLFDAQERRYISGITDPLTGLHNRYYFEKQIESKLKNVPKQAQNALVIIEIDNFSKVVDYYDSQLTEHMIKDLANMIKAHMCEDGLKALHSRVSDNQLAVFYEKISHNQAKTLISTLQANIKSHMTVIDDRPLQYTVSVGMALLHNQQSVHQHFKTAERALEVAKLSGSSSLMVL